MNPIAKDLRSPKYRVRVVRPKKGKGSYRRERDARWPACRSHSA